MLHLLLAVSLSPVTTAAVALDVATHHALLGRRALLLSAALPLEREACLSIADTALAAGASVTLLVPTPASGAVAQDDASLQLLQLMQRKGFPALMEALGFAFGGVAGQYGTGNRPRVDFRYVRADDVEQLSLALADFDVLLLHTPGSRLSPASLDAARFRLQRKALSFVVRRLQARDVPLVRDTTAPRLRWAWLASPPPSASAGDGDVGGNDAVPGLNE